MAACLVSDGFVAFARESMVKGSRVGGHKNESTSMG